MGWRAPFRSIAAAAWTVPAFTTGSALPGGRLAAVRDRVLAGAVLGVLVAVGSTIELIAAHGVTVSALAVIVAMVSLPCLVALVSPLLAWRVMTIALLVPPDLNTWAWPITAFVAYLGVTLLTATTVERTTLLGLALICCALPVLPAGPQERMPDGIIFGLFGLIGLTVSFGGALRQNRMTRLALDDEIQRSEAEQVRATVLAERAQLARELHDVVAHHMSVIAIQADVTPRVVPDLPQPALDAFRSIRTGSTTALAEMRRLVDSLRDEDDGAERRPQPRLEDIATLVESVRATGTAVRLTVHGSVVEAPAPVAISAYRIVQEALANALQHAPGAAVTVQLDQDPDRVLLVVTNAAPTRVRSTERATEGRPGTRRTGHGLIGMGERAHLLGGTVQTGPTPQGGFEVSAVLPIDSRPTAREEQP
jgi:signal transduction histidine kinase